MNEAQLGRVSGRVISISGVLHEILFFGCVKFTNAESIQGARQQENIIE